MSRLWCRFRHFRRHVYMDGLCAPCWRESWHAAILRHPAGKKR